jgi:hypothetical protein
MHACVGQVPERHVLADGQAENVGLVGQGESVQASVVVELDPLLERKLLEFGGVEDAGADRSGPGSGHILGHYAMMIKQCEKQERW